MTDDRRVPMRAQDLDLLDFAIRQAIETFASRRRDERERRRTLSSDAQLDS